MSSNSYYKTIQALAVTAPQMNAGVTATPTAYGLTAAQASALDVAVTNFLDAKSAVEDKRSEYRAAVEEQNQYRDELVTLMSQYTSIIYKNPTVTPAMIALLGLEPRDTSPTASVPFTPTSFEATPFADGSVNFSWNRNGNSRSTMFIIEQKNPGGEWSVLTTTTKTKVSLFGFTPGEEKWFRVYASVNNQASAPSFEDPIYAAAPSQPSISLAA
ncbi:MAG TPA: hypothetical protein PKA27_13770 [Fimbriimonadaceae bacterium]|nr:hypothetical protein [Fimbriimonadaceae bacterium]